MRLVKELHELKDMVSISSTLYKNEFTIMQFDLSHPSLLEAFIDFLADEYSDIVLLTLVDCGITEIPKNIGRLQNIQILNFSENKVTEIPDEIGELRNLEHLIVRNNTLEVLPDTLVYCEKLKGIYLSGNGFTVIPPVLFACREL